MTQPSVGSTPRAKNPVAAHPFTSALITLLILASICCTLFVPIYARETPKLGPWPFFYWYLILYMPAVGIAMWVVVLLQKRLAAPAAGEGSK
jgi:hypothetical protein